MDKITFKNYESEIKNVDVSKLPEAMQKAHKMAQQAIPKGFHEKNESVNRTLSIYLEKLNDFIEKQEKPKKETQPRPKKKPRKRHTQTAAKRAKSKAASKTTTTSKSTQKAKPKAQSPKSKTQSSKRKTTKVDYSNNTLVKDLPLEIQYIRKFVGWAGRKINKTNVLNFLRTIQKDNAEGKFSVKTGKYGREINHIQDRLVEIYNSEKYPPRKKFEFKLTAMDERLLKEYHLIDEHVVRPSVQYFKRFINLYSRFHKGDPVTKLRKSARLLKGMIDKGMENSKIPTSDPNRDRLKTISNRLARFINGTDDEIKVSEAELQGFAGLAGMGADIKKK